MFKSLPFEPREIKATESRLQAIYDAAALGLKGDSLALAAGLLPTEYRRLCQMDPLAEMAEAKGRADAEAEAAGQLREAALQEAESRVINGRVLSAAPAALTRAEPTALAYATTEPINATADL